jgi:hypothetical protein
MAPGPPLPNSDIINFPHTKNLWNFVDERLKYSISITAELNPSATHGNTSQKK